MRTIQERFEQKVERVPFTDCHFWIGATTPFGYGKIGKNGKWVQSHRFAFEQAYGSIPEDKYVLHTCDVPSCVNPNHLYLGTYKDNARDREERNRGNHAFGERHGKSKLTKEQVLKIRDLHDNEDMSCWSLGKQFGINSKSVRDIVNRKNWTHI